MTAVLVPQLSLSMEEAKVSRWLVEDGAAVTAGQLVVEVETDKATVEIEAQAAGVLRIVARRARSWPSTGCSRSSSLPCRPGASQERADGAGTAPVPVAHAAESAVLAAPAAAAQGRSHHPLLGGSPASEGSSLRPCGARGPADGS